MPAKVMVLCCREGERNGMVVQGADGPGRGGWRRHSADRRPHAQGRKDGVRFTCCVRRSGPSADYPRGLGVCSAMLT